MNEQKIREAFEAWLQEGIEETGTIRPSRDKVASYLSVWEGAWQAATAATQRDAMAVAEAARKSMIDVAYNSQTPHGTITGEMESVDLAAIVEAVLPGRRETVNPRLLEALKYIERTLTNLQPHIPQACQPNKHEFIDNYFDPALECARAAIAAAEAAQPVCASYPCWSCKKPVTIAQRVDADGDCPHCHVELDDEDWPADITDQYLKLLRDFAVKFGKDDADEGLLEFYARKHYEQGVSDASQQLASAQQQGEPVAEIDQRGCLKILNHNAIDYGVKLYTAPPAPACRMPDGWQAGLWRYGFTNEAFGLMKNGPYVLLEQVEMALLAAAQKGCR